jgi:hypothetical protein
MVAAVAVAERNNAARIAALSLTILIDSPRESK